VDQVILKSVKTVTDYGPTGSCPTGMENSKYNTTTKVKLIGLKFKVY
jgi:hypothetical protein